MSRWAFPEHPFNIEDKTGFYALCAVIAEDDEMITFDYTAKISEVRMRAQILKENIVSISWLSPTTAETLLRSCT